MAWLFLVFTGRVVVGIAAAIVGYLDNRRRQIALLVLAAWVLYTGSLGFLASPAAAPPRVALILIPVLLGALFLACSDAGRDLALSVPVSLLIGAQVFRVIVELFMRCTKAVASGATVLTFPPTR